MTVVPMKEISRLTRRVPCSMRVLWSRLGLLALLVAVAVPRSRAQDDCYAGNVHTQPQTIRGFLIRFQQSSSVAYGPACRVEVYSLRGGKVFSSEDVALRLTQPAGEDVNGDGAPDIVLEGYSGGAHCCWTYWFVSLGDKPGLLTKIENQDAIKLVPGRDGKTDIQTADGSFDYFDCLSHAESPLPTVFLRLEGRTLKDVGVEHLEAYERQREEARKQLSSARLTQFRAARTGDDLCSGEPREAMPLVLEVVLAYLYAGDEQAAWKALDQMWPPFDEQRIRAKIQKARSTGVLRYTKVVPAGSKRSATRK